MSINKGTIVNFADLINGIALINFNNINGIKFRINGVGFNNEFHYVPDSAMKKDNDIKTAESIIKLMSSLNKVGIYSIGYSNGYLDVQLYIPKDEKDTNQDK